VQVKSQPRPENESTYEPDTYETALPIRARNPRPWYEPGDQADGILYDNLQTSLNTYIGGFGPYGEIADDIQMTGSGIFSSARSPIRASASTATDLTMTLYAMDGAPTPGSFGFTTPGTSSIRRPSPSTAAVSPSSSTRRRARRCPAKSASAVFGGVDFDVATSDAGPALSDPVPPASSFYDYWLKGFAGDPDWALYDFVDASGNRIPSPISACRSTASRSLARMGMIGLGVVAAGALWRRAASNR
jgi:hypothetical protein